MYHARGTSTISKPPCRNVNTVAQAAHWDERMVNVPIQGILARDWWRVITDGFDSVRFRRQSVANTTIIHNSDRGAPYQWDASGERQSATVKGALFTPTDRLSVEAGMLWQETQSDDLTLYNLHYQRQLQEKFMLEPTSSEVTLTSLDVSYDFGPAVLTSLTGLYTRDYDEVVDYTFVIKGTRAPGYTYVPAASTLQTLAEWTTVTQEVRLQSSHRDSSNAFLRRLDWVVGAFWMQEDRDNWQIADAPGWGVAAPANPLPLANDVLSASDNAVKDSSKALFVDATFDVTGKPRGCRYPVLLSTELHGESAPNDANYHGSPRGGWVHAEVLRPHSATDAHMIMVPTAKVSGLGA